jgi:hypothetical protein
LVYSTKDFTRTSDKRAPSPPELKNRLLEKKPEPTREQIVEKMLRAQQLRGEVIQAKINKCKKRTPASKALADCLNLTGHSDADLPSLFGKIGVNFDSLIVRRIAEVYEPEPVKKAVKLCYDTKTMTRMTEKVADSPPAREVFEKLKAYHKNTLSKARSQARQERAQAYRESVAQAKWERFSELRYKISKLGPKRASDARDNYTDLLKAKIEQRMARTEQNRAKVIRKKILTAMKLKHLL